MDRAGLAAAGEVVMVVAAEQGQVVQVGRPAVDPGLDVGAFAPGWWVGVAGKQPLSRAISNRSYPVSDGWSGLRAELDKDGIDDDTFTKITSVLQA